MYEFILNTKLVTALLALALALVLGHSRRMAGLWWRGLLFNFTPAFAAAFYLIAPFAPATPNPVDVLSGLAFELTILFLYFKLLRRLMVAVSRLAEADVSRLLRNCLILQILLALPVVSSAGFGLMSEGSRIDYLYEGSLGKYFTYASILLSGIQAGLIAARITSTGRPGWLGSLTILLNFGWSILAGSKGGVFIWLVSVLALIQYRRSRISATVIAIFLIIFTVGLTISVSLISDALGITTSEFSELALSRFFLSNDARAMAFDLRHTQSESVAILTESFRSLSTLIGMPALNLPIGVQLYDDYFGVSGGSGANGSLMSLGVYYMPNGFALLPALVGIIIATGFYFLLDQIQRAMRRADSKFMMLSMGIFVLLQLSQDFLAFQVLIALICMGTVIIWLFDRATVMRPNAQAQIIIQ